MRRQLIAAAATLTAAGGIALAATGPTSASTEYTVPAGSQYLLVTTPTSHGYLVKFAVGYTDGYVHKDPIGASNKIHEIDSYTGQAPDIQGYDGCNSKHQPDMLTSWDNDGAGLGGGSTPATSLHHNVTITITPVGSGPYFLWCHYEHGPETWVTLTFQDGRTDEIYFASPTYFSEILISYGGTTTAVSAVPADE